MILIVHNDNQIVEIKHNNESVEFNKKVNIIAITFDLVTKYKDEVLFWCHESLVGDFIYRKIIDNFEDKKTSFDFRLKPLEIFTYNPDTAEFLPEQIGYIDFRSPFVNVVKDVTYGTWMLSSACGVIHCNTLEHFHTLKSEYDFDKFLVELGFLALKMGLFPYSKPDLLTDKADFKYGKRADFNYLFSFVKRHFLIRQYLFFFFMMLRKEGIKMITPFLISIFKMKVKIPKINLSKIYCAHETRNLNEEDTIDVIIPTLGRPKELEDFLLDLNEQTIIPKKVVIIEQQPTFYKGTELNNLWTKSWSFNITHKLISHVGACKARNIALGEVCSRWIFFADDDIRIKSDLFEKTISFLKNNNIKIASIASYQKGESIDILNNPSFWSEFSSGCSLVDIEAAKITRFDNSLEFGFGEDTDYGYQLRKKGYSIIYYNKVPVFHLKAPLGGFRSKTPLPWSNVRFEPMPAPTILKCFLKNNNKYQFEGFKMYTILKNAFMPGRNFLRIRELRKRFEKSENFATKL